MFPQFSIEVAQFKFDTDGYTNACRLAIVKATRLAARAFLLAADSRIPVRTGFLRGAFGNLEDIVGAVSGGKVVPKSNPSSRLRSLQGKIRSSEHKLASVPAKGIRRKQIEASLPPGNKRAGATKILAKEAKVQGRIKDKLKLFRQGLKKYKGVIALRTHEDRTDTIGGEYYYPTPVGRHGRKDGVHRGGAVLKTPSSGRPFATPPGDVQSFDVTTLRWNFAFSVNIRYYLPNDLNYGWESWRAAVLAYNETLVSALAEYPQILDYVGVFKLR